MENRTRDARKQAGLTLGQGARILRMEPADLSDIELAIEPPGAPLIEKMSEAYGASVDWMIGEVPRIDAKAAEFLRGYDALSFHERDSLAEFLSLRTKASKS